MPKLEEALENSRTIAVFFGPAGVGAWREEEKNLALDMLRQSHTQLRRVIPVLLPGGRAEDVTGFMRMRTWVDLADDDGFERLVAGIRGHEPGPPEPGDRVARPVDAGSRRGASSPPMSQDRLPASLSRVFVGRQAEIEQLDAAWRSKNTSIATLIAAGGTGKSAIVRQWLDRSDFGRTLGARKVFTWSFYRQGLQVNEAGDSEFMTEALRYFGDPHPTAASSEAKGKRLADLVQSAPNLLVLDGLEPLQMPPTDRWAGKLKARGLQSFLTQLASFNDGLCVLTSRLPLTHLAGINQSTDRLREIRVLPLTTEEGAAVLSGLGVRGSAADLRRAAADFRGHALSLTLLGNIVNLHDIDISRRDTILDPLESDDQLGHHAERVMAAYERWFTGKTEMAVLEFIGIFDRPVEDHLVEAIAEAGDGLDAEILPMPRRTQWRQAVRRLRELSLVASRDPRDPQDALDTHPIIREHVARRLRERDEARWRGTHRAVYEYLLTLAPEQHPRSMSEMRPLYRAAWHGCHAGLHEQVLDGLFRARILRPPEYFSVRALGALSEDLDLLRGFFSVPFEEVHPALDGDRRSFVLQQTGYCLRHLGRIEDACQTTRAALRLSKESEDWSQAAQAALNLAESLFVLGKMPQALRYGDEGIALARRAGDEHRLGNLLTKLAAIVASMGRCGQAERLVTEGRSYPSRSNYDEQMKRYHACYILECKQEYRAAIETARLAQNALTEHGNELQLRHMLAVQEGRNALMLSRTTGDTTGLEGIVAALEEALDGLTKLKKNTVLPRCLLVLAEVRVELGDTAGARKDIDEAQSLAETAEMRVHHVDVVLARAFLELARGRRELAREQADEARTRLGLIDYGLRRVDLVELERRLDVDSSPS